MSREGRRFQSQLCAQRGDLNETLPQSRHLNTWSLVGGDLGRLRRCGLAEEVRPWGWALRFSKMCTIWCTHCCLFAIGDVSFQSWLTTPVATLACGHTSLLWQWRTVTILEPQAPSQPYFLQVAFLTAFVTAIKKPINTLGLATQYLAPVIWFSHPQAW